MEILENSLEYEIDISDYDVYQRYSNGYVWMGDRSVAAIQVAYNNGTLEDVVNDKIIWNIVATTVFSMPYINEEFVVPKYSDTSDSDIKTQDTIGKIINKLVNIESSGIYVNKNLSFVLYNDKISIKGNEDLVDANIINLVFNVLTVFMLRFIKNENKITG